jgi:hypothetical protein
MQGVCREGIELVCSGQLKHKFLVPMQTAK